MQQLLPLSLRILVVVVGKAPTTYRVLGDDGDGTVQDDTHRRVQRDGNAMVQEDINRKCNNRHVLWTTGLVVVVVVVVVTR